MTESKKNLIGFKRFSDMKKSKVEEIDLSIESPDVDVDLPMNPNISKKSVKIEKPASLRGLIPDYKETELPNDEKLKVLGKDNKENESVKTIGKVARFPKNVAASKAYNFLENVKVSKKSIWYIMVEKQNNELQMLKYNHKEGVDLSKFINELKAYYVKKYSKNTKMCKLVENMKIDGNDKYSMIKNIPLIEVDGKKMITRVTEDLIRLLSN